MPCYGGGGDAQRLAIDQAAPPRRRETDDAPVDPPRMRTSALVAAAFATCSERQPRATPASTTRQAEEKEEELGVDGVGRRVEASRQVVADQVRTRRVRLEVLRSTRTWANAAPESAGASSELDVELRRDTGCSRGKSFEKSPEGSSTRCRAGRCAEAGAVPIAWNNRSAAGDHHAADRHMGGVRQAPMAISAPTVTPRFAAACWASRTPSCAPIGGRIAGKAAV